MVCCSIKINHPFSMWNVFIDDESDCVSECSHSGSSRYDNGDDESSQSSESSQSIQLSSPPTVLLTSPSPSTTTTASEDEAEPQQQQQQQPTFDTVCEKIMKWHNVPTESSFSAREEQAAVQEYMRAHPELDAYTTYLLCRYNRCGSCFLEGGCCSQAGDTVLPIVVYSQAEKELLDAEFTPFVVE